MIQMLVATLMWALVASLLIFRRKRTDRSITRAAFTIDSAACSLTSGRPVRSSIATRARLATMASSSR